MNTETRIFFWISSRYIDTTGLVDITHYNSAIILSPKQLSLRASVSAHIVYAN
jgi:hypothetical protein